MKNLSLIISLIGIFFLGYFMINSRYISVKNPGELEKFNVNSKVIVDGIVDEERIIYQGSKILKINGIEVICECYGNFKGKKVKIKGVIEEYEDKKQIRVLEIAKLN